jgi:hypothetical protein
MVETNRVYGKGASKAVASSQDQISIPNRLLLLFTSLLAAYLISVGVEGFSSLAIVFYTIAFGVLLIASLLIIILGYEVLESPVVAIVSTILPLSLSSGLVVEYLPNLSSDYMLFALMGLLMVIFTRFLTPGKPASMTLAVVHGIAGLIIFGLPIFLSLSGTVQPGFFLVGVGGALIGVGGLLLSFLKAGKPILPKKTLLAVLPGLLLLMTTAFVTGFLLS